MNFRLGCAVWSYKGWIGDFYPLGSRPSEFLHLYSQRLTTVEGNTTFYAVPDQDTVTRWAAETPPGFEFCLKLPRDLTHKGLLQSSIPGALSFLEQMRGLGDRLGPIFAQLPPRYGPDFWDDLITFLEAWPRNEAPLALEVRHPGWFREPIASQLTTVLSQLGVGRVLLDTRPIYENLNDTQVQTQRKPNLPVQFSVTANFCLIRFVSHPQRDFNQIFLQNWVEFIDHWLRQGIRLYFFVHCPVEAQTPGTARYFQQMLEQHGIPVPDLPKSNTNQSSTQLNLF